MASQNTKQFCEGQNEAKLIYLTAWWRLAKVPICPLDRVSTVETHSPIAFFIFSLSSS